MSRWLIEPRAGVFIGNLSSRVRDKIWEKCIERKGKGHVLQIWSYPCPQGYKFRSSGMSKRILEDFEGLALVRYNTDKDK